MKTKFWLVLAGMVLMLLAPREAMGGGACTAARFHDWQKTCPLYAGAGGAAIPPACPNCSPGMPRWWVSEPYVSLGMVDTPLSYVTSSGQTMDFTFLYKQRYRLPESDETPITSYDLQVRALGSYYSPAVQCGGDAFWGNNWNMSVIIKAIGNPNNFNRPYKPPFSGGYYALVFNTDGTVDNYTNLNYTNIICQDPQSQTILTDVAGQGYPKVAEQDVSLSTNLPTADTNGIYWGDPGVGVKLIYADGSQDIFGLSAYIEQDNFPLTPTTNYVMRLLLTQRIDPAGRTVQLGYEQYSPLFSGVSIYRPKYIVDPDGRTNQFRYTATNNLQLAEIDDPYGRKMTLAYNGDGTLARMVDAAGLTNSFQYPASQVTSTTYYSGAGSDVVLYTLYTTNASSGWINQMVTRYGTNRFAYYEVDDNTVTDGVQQRGLYISEPEGAAQLYYYLHKGAGLIPGADTAPAVSGVTNFDDGTAGGISGHNALYYRNTFHWGRRQFAATTSYVQNNLAAAVQANLAWNANSYFANAVSYLNTNDFNKADLKHWLWQSDNSSISGSVSSERAPSFDAAGNNPGLRTWYNYTGKPIGGAEDIGGNPQIACVAKVLPDTTSQYTTYNFYPPGSAGAGLVSDNETTYTKPVGTIGLLTNWFAYAANNVDLLSVSNSAGQYLNYGYNGSHQVIAITNSLNQVTTLSWNPNLTGVQFPSGQSITLNYYLPATPATGTSAMLQWITFQPQGRSITNNSYYAGLPSSTTDDRGVTLQNTWDGLNRLTSTIFPDTTYISNVYTRLDLTATKDRLGNWTRFAYDGLQHLTNYSNANLETNSYSYCGCGSLNSIVDALGNPTYLNYDNQGNLTNVSFPDFSSLTWQYDLAGRMTNMFDGLGRYLRLAYNNQGLVTNVSSANETLQSIAFDALNRPAIITDANGVTVSNTFDAINELTKRTWPDGISEGYGYSAVGLVAYTNRDGKATFYSRDGAGRLLTVLNANQELTRFAYDSLDNVTDLWDGNTNHTQWQYNGYGWLTNKMDGLNRNAFRYAYNPNGWMTNRWTPEKGNTGYTYDNVGNPKSILYPQSSILYAYDALNRLTNMVDALGSHNFGWTAGSQLASESDGWTTNTWSYVQQLRTAMTIAQPGGNWTQTYNYDAGWRMTNIVSPAGTFNYQYDPQRSTLITQLALPNGASITNGYDALARLTQTVLNNHWGHTLDGYSYTPDPLGLRTNILRNLGLTTNSVSVGYDNIGQITNWSAKEWSGVSRLNEQLSWAYDAAHNLHSRGNGNLSQTFTTDSANELTNVTRAGTFTMSGALPAPTRGVTVNGQPAQIYGDFAFAGTNLTLINGNNTFTMIATNIYGLVVTNTVTVNLPLNVNLNFDNNGSLTNDGALLYGYDAENQLTNITVVGSWKSDFVYDGLNRRRIERDFNWNGSAWALTNEVHYVYDGYSVIQERNTNNNVLVTYTRGLDLSGSLRGAGGIGGLLARTDANGSTYYHADGAGNITALMDGSEDIVARYLYNPYGKLLGQWGSMANANEMQFSSMPRHNLSGLSLYAFRPYGPNLQRWPNQDPIGEAGGLNLYGFVGNDPVNEVDMFGLSSYFDENYGDVSSFQNPASFSVVAGPAVNGAFWAMDKADQGIDALRNSASPPSRAIGEGLWIASWVYGGPETKGLRKARDLEKAVKATKDVTEITKCVEHGHHPLAKFLGGDADQLLSKLDPKIHTEFHQLLGQNLKNAGIPLNVGGKGGSAADWAQYMQANPGAQQTAFNAILDASRTIDAKYGTHITQDVWNNIMQGKFTPYP